MTKKVLSISEIEALQIRGNHFSDMHIFEHCHSYIHNPSNLMVDKIRAIKKIDDCIGETNDCNEQSVIDYIKNS